MDYVKLIDVQFNIECNSAVEMNLQSRLQSPKVSRLPIIEEEVESLAREQQLATYQTRIEETLPPSYPRQLLIMDKAHESVSNRTTSPPDGVLDEKSQQTALAAERSITSPVVKQGVLQHNAVEPSPPSPPMEASVRKSAAASIHAFEDQQLAAVSVSSDTLDLTSLERIRSSGSLQLIRDGVEIGRKTVSAIEAALGEAKGSTSEGARFLTEIMSLRGIVSKVRTVIGVLGNTGAGKSSLINAILDEDNLIITSGSRACTAVATEIAFNLDPDPAHSYRAEIEFISKEEWAAEIHALLPELVGDEQKLSSEYNNPDSDAGVAYEKIKAVFPDITHAQIAHNHAASFIRDPSLKDILGTVRFLSYRTADELRTEIRRYVDSTEKTRKGKKSTMAYWPLVKAARVYVRSKALQSGAILVDLPGVQDANAARSAVAERYMAECSALWIVSPITRAVSDKAAKQLLGSSFRQQLTMDGNYCNVTFICSKTDQMKVEEVVDQLDEDGNIAAKFQEEGMKAAQVRDLQSRKEAVDEEKQQLQEMQDELDENDVWEGKSKKHKHGRLEPVPGADLCPEESCPRCLTADLKVLRHRSTALGRQIKIENDMRKSLEIEGLLLCIQARNDYSANAIRRDFADGIRETIAQAEALDEEAFPSGLNQDYNQLAKSLSVFCVSSECYQQLRTTRACNKAILRGFSRCEDTQIPQLQEHAFRLGEIQLDRARRLLLTGLARLARSLTLWAPPTGLNRYQSKPVISEKDRAEMHCILDTLEDLLQQAMAKCKKEIAEELRSTMKQKHIDPLKVKCNEAGAKLPKAAQGLHQKDGVELPWNTYKALCRNRGCPRTRKAVEMKVNFNNALFAPLKENIAVPWNHFFTNTLEEVRRRHVLRFVQELRVFAALVQETPRLDELQPGSRALITDQANSQIDAIQLFDNLFTSIIKADQREASRMFEPCIAESLDTTYAECAAMRGMSAGHRPFPIFPS
jgi:GTPase SAR1 family protein